MEVAVQHLRKINDKIHKTVSLHIGQEEDYLSKLIDKNTDHDIFLTPKQAKKHKLVNHIGCPKLTTSVHVKHEFL